MARTGIDLGSSQLQMGTRLKAIALVVALCLASSASSADAATKKPTPTPTAKVSVKASPKATTKPIATAKPTSIATSKPSVKATAKATAPTTAKPSVSAQPTALGQPTVSAKPKPKPKPKPRPRKKIRLTPSPKPKWPPVDFEFESGIYAKVPTSKELVSVISAKTNLASQVKACSEFVCGAVQVAAEPGCLWWEVNSQVLSKEGVILGNLRTISTPSAVREVKTILLISPEPIETLEYISNIEVICHQDPRPDGASAATYTKVVG